MRIGISNIEKMALLVLLAVMPVNIFMHIILCKILKYFFFYVLPLDPYNNPGK